MAHKYSGVQNDLHPTLTTVCLAGTPHFPLYNKHKSMLDSLPPRKTAKHIPARPIVRVIWRLCEYLLSIHFVMRDGNHHRGRSEPALRLPPTSVHQSAT